MRLSDDWDFRGLVHQVTDDTLMERLDSGGVTAYIGFDPTAASLHRLLLTSPPRYGTPGLESWSPGCLFIRRLNCARFLGTLRGHVGAVYRLVWSGDSRLGVTASEDSTIKLWDAHVRMKSMMTQVNIH